MSAGSDVLRAMYWELTTMLDARIVAANMYQRNALTVKELQTIQSLRDHPVKAAETLLNIIMEQPDAVYLCFLDVLKHTEQQYVYRRLVEDGYEGRYITSSVRKINTLNVMQFYITVDEKQCTGVIGVKRNKLALLN